jgi:hypothetical protein
MSRNPTSRPNLDCLHDFNFEKSTQKTKALLDTRGFIGENCVQHYILMKLRLENGMIFQNFTSLAPSDFEESLEMVRANQQATYLISEVAPQIV